MRKLLFALLLLAPVAALADGVEVTMPMVPVAPPGTKVHAAFMMISNPGTAPRHLTGVSAEGYRMAHIHKSEVKDGVATMSPVDLVEIAPGQTVTFEHGGLHIMLMGPEGPVAMGEVVRLTLQFANGDTQLIEAPVKRLMHGAHGS